ncbi:heterokaryon incompatibility protein-domain-containing protein [Hyaloscypha finlandica]|nr:heterokaryon incompatibility protein-domain-containing protein [Hyaloscypha finlandica]
MFALNLQKCYTDEPFSINPDAEGNDIRELTIRTSLCERCRTLPGFAFGGTFTKPRLWPPGIPVAELIRRKNAVEELRKSSTNCQLCTLILDAIALGKRSRERYRKEELVLLESGTKPRRNPKLAKDCLYLLADFTKEDAHIGPAELNILRGNEVIGILPVTIGARSQWVRAIHLNSMSSVNFGMIRKWLDACEENHADDCCQPARYMEGFTVPTRLIEVKGRDDVGSPRLVLGTSISSTSDLRYIALSHCWGASPERTIPQTTSLNINDRKRRIPWDTLPKTFQDAILVARGIGVPYVWIDSLCIKQGDDSDWKREAALMHKVYTGSYLTISASASENSHGGCFVAHDNPKKVRNCTWMPDGILVTVHPAFDTLNRSITGPLSSRGWTFQEYHLSPRILHFTKGRILWECREYGSEDRPKLGDSSVNSPSRLVRRMIGENREDFLPTALGAHVEDMRRLDQWESDWWYAAVRDYSSRQLKYKTDKLPALSGVARAIYAYSKQWYIAGLWILDLPLGLLWQPSKERRQQNISNRSLPWEQELPDPLLPYWSWAAFDGEVDYEMLQGFDHGCIDVTYVGVDSSSDNQTDPFGRVRNAHLRIRSQFAVQVKLSEKDYVPGFGGLTGAVKYYLMFAQLRIKYLVSRARMMKNLSGILWFDTNPLDLPDTTFLFFALCRSRSHFSDIKSRDGEKFDLGLVLVRIPDRVPQHAQTFGSIGVPQYRRVGLFEVASGSVIWQASVSSGEIVLV